jgi:predicted nuclease of predicted toxin-antitoxin system
MPTERRRRVLLDECMPHDLRFALAVHDVETAKYASLSDIDDDDLLDAMAGRFEVLITADRSLPLQQNMTGRPIAIVVVRTQYNLLQELLPLVPDILAAIGVAVPGEVRLVE